MNHFRFYPGNISGIKTDKALIMKSIVEIKINKNTSGI
jgi:hypothetical protein